MSTGHDCNICGQSIEFMRDLARYRRGSVYIYFHIPCISKDQKYNEFVARGVSRPISPAEIGPVEVKVAIKVRKQKM